MGRFSKLLKPVGTYTQLFPQLGRPQSKRPLPEVTKQFRWVVGYSRFQPWAQTTGQCILSAFAPHVPHYSTACTAHISAGDVRRTGLWWSFYIHCVRLWNMCGAWIGSKNQSLQLSEGCFGANLPCPHSSCSGFSSAEGHHHLYPIRLKADFLSTIF